MRGFNLATFKLKSPIGATKVYENKNLKRKVHRKKRAAKEKVRKLWISDEDVSWKNKIKMKRGRERYECQSERGRYISEKREKHKKVKRREKKRSHSENNEKIEVASEEWEMLEAITEKEEERSRESRLERKGGLEY